MTDRPLKIDCHTHIFPPDLPRFKERFGYGGFGYVDYISPCSGKMMWDDGRFIRNIEGNCWDPEARLKDCAKHDVDVQVLSTVPLLFSYHAQPNDALEIARYLNDHLASVVARYPKRFVGLAALPMQAPELAAKELERAVTQLGLRGAQIGTHVNAWNFSDPELLPVFETAERLGAALFVHPWDMMGSAKMPKYWLPWLVGMPAEVSLAICSLIFGGVFEKFPKLRFGFAHAGGSFPGTVGRIQQGFYARPDLCQPDCKIPPRDYLGHFWVDSLTHDPKMLEVVTELVGPERVMLGTDYPFPLGELIPGETIDSIRTFDPVTRERLLGRNALEWLGLSREKFL